MLAPGFADTTSTVGTTNAAVDRALRCVGAKSDHSDACLSEEASTALTVLSDVIGLPSVVGKSDCDAADRATQTKVRLAANE